MLITVVRMPSRVKKRMPFNTENEYEASDNYKWYLFLFSREFATLGKTGSAQRKSSFTYETKWNFTWV